MTIKQADARDLLGIALKTFREVVLPAVPAEQRVPALMIVNALSIAERELAAGQEPERRLIPKLAKLLGEAVPETLDGPDLAKRFAELSGRLCAGITAGAFDDNPDLREYLWEVTRARLAVTNPKYVTDPPK
ncbi:MAG TPA: DUF6285 domain-containing protein [Azospirillum sp.]|nr:DUF6285 domain-containing protein [Azospirillum sp.]